MPISSVAMSVEGVLQKNVSSAPIPVGVALYHSLSTNFNILLTTDMSQKEADRWLLMEALNKHSAIEYNEDKHKYFPATRKLSQLSSLRNRGYHIDLVIEPSPLISALLIENGFSVMTFTHAQYALPKWRPDYEERPRPWDDLHEAANKLAELKSLDDRMKELDEVSYD